MKTKHSQFPHPEDSRVTAPDAVASLAGAGSGATRMVWLSLLLMVAMLGLGGCKEKKGAAASSSPTGTTTTSSAPSGAKPGSLLEGKPMQEWVAQLDSPASETAGEALRVLAKASGEALQPVKPKLEAAFEKFRDESQSVAGRAAVLLVGRLGVPFAEDHHNPMFRLLVLEDDETVRRLMEEVLKKAVADKNDVVFDRAMSMALDARQSSTVAASARVILTGNREKARERITQIETAAVKEAQARGQTEPDPFQRAARLKALEALK